MKHPFLPVIPLALAIVGCVPQKAPYRPQTATDWETAQAAPAAIEALDLTGQSLPAWPDEMQAFVNLSRVSLRKTGLTEYPRVLGSLPALTWIDLGENRLTASPDPALLTQVTTLYLSDNAIAALPETIGSLTNLVYLNLDRNQLTALPESIGALTALKWLRLNGNKITAVPDSIAALKGLRRLYLKGNPLTPEEKARLRTLLPDTELID